MISDKLDGSSQILTKEEDLSNKESVLKIGINGLYY